MGAIFSNSSSVGKDVDMASAKAKYVTDLIASNKIVIFSKSFCPYCTMAKEQFKKLNAEFFLLELDGRDDTDEIQDILGSMTGARSVPRVFVNGNFIGGGTDVKKLQERGELAKMIA